MTDITVKHVNKAYGDKKVLEDFSAVFEYGRCTAIMGPSGCGKTTLLKILMGIEKNHTGSVEGMPEHFAAVFQEDRLCEGFSVYDNVRMVMGTEGVKGKGTGGAAGKADTAEMRQNGEDIPSQPEAIDKCLEELGLKEYAHQKVSDLSGGQKRRVAIARALMYDAELLIMDEPFKGLDEVTRRAAAEAIRRRKRTVIIVTHNPEEAGLMDAEVITMERAQDKAQEIAP